MALYFTTYCSLSPPLPSPSHSLALQSIVGLGIQYSLPPFPTVYDHCLLGFVPIMFKSTFPSSFLLLHGLLFALPSIVAYAICFAFVGFAFFQHDYTILVGGILESLQYLSLVICPVICFVVLIFQHSPPFAGSYIFLTISHSNILSTFVISVCTTLFFTLFDYGFQYVHIIIGHGCQVHLLHCSCIPCEMH